ncbi:hypothetical protein FRAAL4060 [Frankia alni ACN14a]|uniref:Uncharacterized protein n=1 Tax=Frankia alni (strain DSM 45986 / CECT 9034 / ACN14a) TaxID=326424 RepID=Q0RIG7_FRAAA|nr:hypothetical protein FRAAL4060 [Frankia alni ACN14a]
MQIHACSLSVGWAPACLGSRPSGGLRRSHGADRQDAGRQGARVGRPGADRAPTSAVAQAG